MNEIALLLKTFGCPGLAALLIGAIVYLYRRVEHSHKRELAMAERILPLMEEVKGFLR